MVVFGQSGPIFGMNIKKKIRGKNLFLYKKKIFYQNLFRFLDKFKSLVKKVF